MQQEKEKTCCDCGQAFPVSSFYKYPNGWIHSYCRECHSIRTREYAKKHPEKRRQYSASVAERTREIRAKWRVATRRKVVDALGGKCSRCGFDDDRALQVDHVNGGGNKEREALGGANQIYRKILKHGVAGYQLLCANCNWIKRAENKEYGSK